MNLLKTQYRDECIKNIYVKCMLHKVFPLPKINYTLEEVDIIQCRRTN